MWRRTRASPLPPTPSSAEWRRLFFWVCYFKHYNIKVFSDLFIILISLFSYFSKVRKSSVNSNYIVWTVNVVCKCVYEDITSSGLQALYWSAVEGQWHKKILKRHEKRKKKSFHRQTLGLERTLKNKYNNTTTFLLLVIIFSSFMIPCVTPCGGPNPHVGNQTYPQFPSDPRLWRYVCVCMCVCAALFCSALHAQLNIPLWALQQQLIQ